MLGFLRKHQKYFFILITIVIVISFSFFGTYSALGGNNIHEQVAFTTVNGKQITRGQLEEFSQFISTDKEDSKLYGGSLGPNFLNDGVIKKDFLETGLASLLINEFASDLNADLLAKHSREAHFKPYSHPDAPFVSSTTVWNYFAPEIVKNLELVQKTSNPTSKEAIDAKIALYLAERRLPPSYLKQILYHQERQYNWLPHDENLAYQDLAIFGYHNPDDWFGQKFTKLIAQFIINCAQIAEQKGYRVSKEEALADLTRNAHVSFKENQDSPHLASANSNDYMQQQLTRMRLDRTQAVNIWQQVLLFRRLFQDVGNAVLVDGRTYETFNDYANETTTGDLYRLPESMRLNSSASLPLFETYLNAIAKRSKDEQAKLTMPTTFLTPSEIAKKTPELTHKRYLVQIRRVSLKSLEAKVPLRETLAYEIGDTHWKELQKQFPDLGIKEAKSAEERLNILDGLDAITRSRVDNFARAAIVKEHPEWLEDALNAAPIKKEVVSIRLKGESPAFIGLKQGEEFISRLDAVPIGETMPNLSKVTFDNANYYQITVLDKSPTLEVLSFQEAQNSGVLEKLLTQKLEPYYVQIRNNYTDKFQNADKSWKPLEDVKFQVAELYFEPVTKAIKAHYSNEQMSQDRVASLRFYTFLEQAKVDLENHPENESKWIREDAASQEEATLSQAESLDTQWKLDKSEMMLKRKQQSQLLHHAELFDLPKSAFSKTYDAPNGDLYFFHVKDKGIEKDLDAFKEQIARARFLLGGEAEQMLLYELLPQIKDKGAISFSYTNTEATSIEPEES